MKRTLTLMLCLALVVCLAIPGLVSAAEAENTGIPPAMVGTWTGVTSLEYEGKPIPLEITVMPHSVGEYRFTLGNEGISGPMEFRPENQTFSLDGFNFEMSGNYTLVGECLTLNITGVYKGEAVDCVAVCSKQTVTADSPEPKWVWSGSVNAGNAPAQAPAAAEAVPEVPPEASSDPAPEAASGFSPYDACEAAMLEWLREKSTSEKDPWVKAILDPANVRFSYTDSTDTTVISKFTLGTYMPGEGYEKYTNRFESSYSYEDLIRTVGDATAEFTLEFTFDDTRLYVTKESEQAILKAVRKAAGNAKKAFGSKGVCAIFAERMFGTHGTPENYDIPFSDIDHGLSALDHLVFVNAQIKQSLNTDGGPRALVMTCKGVDTAALIDTAYRKAFEVLSRTERANKLSGDEIHDYLTAALLEEVQVMASKNRAVETKISINLVGIIDGTVPDSPYPFGEDYSALLGGYLDAAGAAHSRLLEETLALPDLELPDFNTETAADIVGGWMSEKAEAEKDAWTKALLAAGPAGIRDAYPGDDGLYTAEFLMPAFIPDTEYFKTLTEYFSATAERTDLAYLLNTFWSPDTETVYSLTFSAGDDFRYHAEKSSADQLLKQLRSRASAAKSAFGDKTVCDILSGGLFNGIWSGYGYSTEIVEPSDIETMLKAGTNFTLNVSGGPHALQLKWTGPDPVAFANEYYALLKEKFSMIARANVYSTWEIREAIDNMQKELAESFAEKKPKSSVNRAWTVDLRELRDCMDTYTGGVPAYLKEYYDAFSEAIAPLLYQLREDISVMPDIPVVPLPATGRMSGASGGRKVKFATKDPDINAYIVVKNYYTDEPVSTMFIRGKGSVTCYLEPGTYYAMIAEGTVWHGYNYLFGDEGSYSKTESFDAPGAREYLTLTITGVVNGNMSSYGVDPSDFR